jgi:FMN reductase
LSVTSQAPPPPKATSGAPYIVGIGGTTRERSSSERAVRLALDAAEARGARVHMIPAVELELPMYAPERPGRTPEAEALVDHVRRADGVIIASPGYHGGLSGLIKNALDYVEDLREDTRPYLDGRAVGCIACAYGWQATTTTLVALRSVVHALRGWPTPLGVALNSAEPLFGPDGTVENERAAANLDIMAGQVLAFASGRAAVAL